MSTIIDTLQEFREVCTKSLYSKAWHHPNADLWDGWQLYREVQISYEKVMGCFSYLLQESEEYFNSNFTAYECFTFYRFYQLLPEMRNLLYFDQPDHITFFELVSAKLDELRAYCLINKIFLQGKSHSEEKETKE